MGNDLVNERLLTLEAWARAEYGDGTPGVATLRRWVREGKILPAPEKHGRTYFLVPHARYVKNPKGNRLLRAIYGTETTQSR
jgi:hypothetical protein